MHRLIREDDRFLSQFFRATFDFIQRPRSALL